MNLFTSQTMKIVSRKPHMYNKHSNQTQFDLWIPRYTKGTQHHSNAGHKDVIRM